MLRRKNCYCGSHWHIINVCEIHGHALLTCEPDIVAALESRLGPAQARRRLALENQHEIRVFGGGLNFFHPENWYSLARIIRGCLKLVGMYDRARRNATRIEVRRNTVRLTHLPAAFNDYTILHLTDLHVDINDTIVANIIAAVANLRYDVCVLTGDYRAATAGATDTTVAGMQRICAALKQPIYGVFGNHDSVRMLPAFEAMGIRMLLNESICIDRDTARLGISGVDEPHYYGADDLDKARSSLGQVDCSILLSHTPEIYEQSAAAGFDLMLCGHTHGGQICLPGGIPITLDARLPRRYGRGAWCHGSMQGYTSGGAGTSIVDVRINCPPEVTLHRLQAS